jgi:pyruvate, water dikinase
MTATPAPTTRRTTIRPFAELTSARMWPSPAGRVGLQRAELMVLEALEGAHPALLLAEGRGDEIVTRMASALTVFAEGFAPRDVTYRTIDFRTNEFRGLRGGEGFEPVEANPMIGFRGAVRYTRQPELLRLELDSIARVWELGHRNLHLMLPFVRTVRKLEVCCDLVAGSGLLALPVSSCGSSPRSRPSCSTSSATQIWGSRASRSARTI